VAEAGFVMEVAIWVPVIVALIAGPVMWALKRFERRNDEQHAENGAVLSSIKEAVLENRDDIREVKRDVQDLKADHRHLSTEHRNLAQRLHNHMEGAS
jgi:hypothetical protein